MDFWYKLFSKFFIRFLNERLKKYYRENPPMSYEEWEQQTYSDNVLLNEANTNNNDENDKNNVLRLTKTATDNNEVVNENNVKIKRIIQSVNIDGFMPINMNIIIKRKISQEEIDWRNQNVLDNTKRHIISENEKRNEYKYNYLPYFNLKFEHNNFDIVPQLPLLQFESQIRD